LVFVALFHQASLITDPRIIAVGSGIPQEFGMRGADIVFGGGGAAGMSIKHYYAAKFNGAPELDDSLVIRDATVGYASEGTRTTLTFTRPMTGGFLAAKGE
jgi:hypothetical protein